MSDEVHMNMRYQFIFSDEVYRFRYCNDHITALVISETLVYDVY